MTDAQGLSSPTHFHLFAWVSPEVRMLRFDQKIGDINYQVVRQGTISGDSDHPFMNLGEFELQVKKDLRRLQVQYLWMHGLPVTITINDSSSSRTESDGGANSVVNLTGEALTFEADPKDIISLPVSQEVEIGEIRDLILEQLCGGNPVDIKFFESDPLLILAIEHYIYGCLNPARSMASFFSAFECIENAMGSRAVMRGKLTIQSSFGKQSRQLTRADQDNVTSYANGPLYDERHPPKKGEIKRSLGTKKKIKAAATIRRIITAYIHFRRASRPAKV